MIPTYRPDAKYLRQALESVLQQDPGAGQMQIEVVDDCSPGLDVAAIVKSIAGERVAFYGKPKNLGLVACFNTCIERSRGQWLHILHQDDYVLPGFYERLVRAAQLHPEVSLLATRTFHVDAENVILQVSDRLRNLENGGCEVDDFFYETPLLCPGVVVKRSFYEAHGGFRSDLSFVLDCEMWARVVSTAGGLVTSEILSCYRKSDTSETGRLNRTAESLYDLDRLNQIFANRYPAFNRKMGAWRTLNLALIQAERYSKLGDSEAVKANLDYWRKNAPVWLRLRRVMGKIKRSIFR
jgi:glycosyltransferase involved in cell wall biosynthesis